MSSGFGSHAAELQWNACFVFLGAPTFWVILRVPLIGRLVFLQLCHAGCQIFIYGCACVGLLMRTLIVYSALTLLFLKKYLYVGLPSSRLETTCRQRYIVRSCGAARPATFRVWGLGFRV
jgi:hypothetical protein